jgi:hypothetical protein
MYLDTFSANGVEQDCKYYVASDTSEAIVDGLNNVVSSVSTIFMAIGATYLAFALVYVIAGIVLKKKAPKQNQQAVYPQGGPQKY